MPNSKSSRAQKRSMKNKSRDNNRLINKVKTNDEFVQGVEVESAVLDFDNNFIDYDYDDYFGMTEEEINAVALVPWLTWKKEIEKQTLRRKELKAIEDKKNGQADLFSFGFNKTKEVTVPELKEGSSGLKDQNMINQDKMRKWKEAVPSLENVLNCTVSNNSTSMKNIEVLKHRAVHLYFKNMSEGLNQSILIFLNSKKIFVLIVE
ncbi:hypothetical protein BDB01DRAFT_864731 [Pilobolus umbonatus]|nr:hypothetical protein BDB01DRAFT_864731 [Pilobolus umbonatus]